MTAIQGVASEEGADRKMPPGVLIEGPYGRRQISRFLYRVRPHDRRFDRSAGLGIHGRHRPGGDCGLRRHVFADHGRHRLHASLLRPPQFSLRPGDAGDPAPRSPRWRCRARCSNGSPIIAGTIFTPTSPAMSTALTMTAQANRHVSFVKGMLHAQGGWVWDQADHRWRILRQGYSGRPDRHVLHQDALVLVRAVGGDHSWLPSATPLAACTR